MYTFKRIVGVLLATFAIVSLVVSLLVTVGVWRLRKPVAEAALSALELADATLQTSGQALAVAEDALLNADDSVLAAQETLQSLAQTLGASTPTLELVAGFLGQGLPDTLRRTQGTVASAAESARIVDRVLETLAAIPFLNVPFAPQTPLSETLDDVAGSLGVLPEGLETLSASLRATGGTLPNLAGNLNELGASFSSLDETLAGALQVVESYQELVDRSQALVQSLERLVPVFTGLVPAVLTFIFVWLAAVQAAALMVGWRWARAPEPASSRAVFLEPVN